MGHSFSAGSRFAPNGAPIKCSVKSKNSSQAYGAVVFWSLESQHCANFYVEERVAKLKH